MHVRLRRPARHHALKFTKLLLNLGNAIEALCGPGARVGELAAATRREGQAVLSAAGIDVASPDEEAARRGDLLAVGGRNGGVRPGGSSWQSLVRGSGSIETDFLNGEIALLGRLHGVPTPYNSLLQRLANEAVRRGWAPATLSPEDLMARASAGAPGAPGAPGPPGAPACGAQGAPASS